MTPSGVDDLVGFIGRPDGLHISLPPCYPEDMRCAPHLDQSLQLFRVLRKYRRTSARRNAVRIQSSPRRTHSLTEAQQLSRLEAGLGLAVDYQQHGLLRFREMRIHGGPAGRIDWPRTLQRTVPTPTGRSVFYGHPQRRRLASRDDHALRQLHAATICHVFDRFFGERVDVEAEAPSTDFLRRQLGVVLSRYRGRLYEERQLSVVQMIEAYWDQNLQQARSIDAIWEYTERFEVIWEEMCRKVIAGVSGDASAWPSGRYVGASGEDLGAGLRLVADFVRHVDEHVLVFDAKFYTSDALPDTHSVLKQLAYGFFLSREWHDRGAPSDRIIHVFLLPKHKNLGGHIAHLRGQHLVSPAGRSVALGAPIFLVDLDYGAIASAYLNYTAVDVDLIRRLIVADIAAKKRKE